MNCIVLIASTLSNKVRKVSVGTVTSCCRFACATDKCEWRSIVACQKSCKTSRVVSPQGGDDARCESVLRSVSFNAFCLQSHAHGSFGVLNYEACLCDPRATIAYVTHDLLLKPSATRFLFQRWSIHEAIHTLSEVIIKWKEHSYLSQSSQFSYSQPSLTQNYHQAPKSTTHSTFQPQPTKFLILYQWERSWTHCSTESSLA